jgi:hypothetical protein
MTPEAERKLDALIELFGQVMVAQRDLIAELKASGLQPTPAFFQQFATISPNTPPEQLPEVPPAVHPVFGPVGGRSGPGTEGNK